MLKIKDEKWKEFQERCAEFEFKNENRSYVRSFFENDKDGNFLEIEISKDNKEITYESGYCGSDYLELEALYDLIVSGFVEKK